MKRGVLRSNGFSLIELIVVLGVLILVLALTVAGMTRSRRRADRIICASNLRQLGVAFQSYASAHNGWLPRASHGYDETDGPLWIGAVVDQLSSSKKWQWRDLPGLKVLQCPSHPNPQIPTGYVLNCFLFDQNAPFDMPAPCVRASAIQSPSSKVWLLESSDRYGNNLPPNAAGFDLIYDESCHIVYRPEHLPFSNLGTPASLPRVNLSRHNGGSNLLYADGHVAERVDDGWRLDDFR